jgi:hypothetical protein
VAWSQSKIELTGSFEIKKSFANKDLLFVSSNCLEGRPDVLLNGLGETSVVPLG